MKITVEDLYERLANEEDARICTDISDTACQEVPGNFFRILLAQFLTKLADALASSKVVLPWLLSSAGTPAFFSGLLVPVRESGSLIPQLLIGGYIRQFAIRKQFYVIGSLLQGIAAALMAVAALTLQGAALGWCILTLLIILSISRGLCSVANKDVLGKTIPKSRRGRLSGLSASLSGIITILVTGALYTLGEQSVSFLVIMLAIAFLSWLLAALSFALIEEFKGASDGGGNGIKSAWSNLGLLKSDGEFRRFVITRALLMSSGLAAPFIVLAATPHLDSSGVFLFVIMSGLASLFSGTVWGYLADRGSRRVMLLAAGLASSLFTTTAVFMQGFADQFTASTLGIIYLTAFFLLAVIHQGVRLGRKTYLVDMAGGNKRTDYVAVSNSLIGVLLLIYGAFSAALAQWNIVVVMAFFALSSASAFICCLTLKEV